MAAATASKGSNVFASMLGYSFGGVALGYSVYWASQQKEIHKLDKEVEDVSKLVAKESKALNSNQALIKENQARLQELGVIQDALKSDVIKSEAKLEAARQEVLKWEAEVARQQAALTKAASEGNDAHSLLSRLVSETARIREALTLGEKSLVVAQQKAAEARARLNPLNHPLIKKNTGSGHK